MILYILRHSDAVPGGTAGMADEERPLTEKGIRKMREVARGLRRIEAVPELVLSSPLLRARETAEIAVAEFGGQVPLSLTGELSPSGSRLELYRELRQHRRLAAVMIVGHLPSLGEIAGEIAWGSADHYLEIKKGGACAIELSSLEPGPSGSLLWFLPPAILRDLGSVKA